MMRQIKFRGKDKRTGEWFYGNLFDKDISGKTHISTTRQGCLDIDPETVAQFTGLLDKNGKEIYEGDILRYIGQGADIVGKIYYREVTFKKGSFCMYCADMDIHSPIISHIMNGVLGWDVVGNIHDTPELLNEKCHA